MLNFLSRLFRPFFLFLGVTEMNKRELHNESLKLATKYAELYTSDTLDPGHVDRVEEALEAYKAARRKLPRNGDNGRRYGSTEAWEHTQGYIKTN